MTKIGETLQRKLAMIGEESIPVIVCLRADAGSNIPELKEATPLMEGMVTARLSKSEIQRISQNVDIESIEIDEEMGIM